MIWLIFTAKWSHNVVSLNHSVLFETLQLVVYHFRYRHFPTVKLAKQYISQFYKPCTQSLLGSVLVYQYLLLNIHICYYLHIYHFKPMNVYKVKHVSCLIMCHDLKLHNCFHCIFYGISRRLLPSVAYHPHPIFLSQIV